MPATHRRSLRVALVGAVAALLTAVVIGPAAAAPAVSYRFWGFFQYANGAWTFAQKGPDQTTPVDGSVEGWRFAVSGPDSSRFPRATATFDQLCATTPAQDGKKRVGLIVDFGRAADSEDGATPPEPVATCAVIAPDGTSVDVLRAAGKIRSEKGLICAVGNYPASGCGGEVSKVTPEAAAADRPVSLTLPATASASATATATQAPAAAPTAATDTSTTSTGTWVAYAIVALVIIALAVLLLLRSRRGARQQD